MVFLCVETEFRLSRILLFLAERRGCRGPWRIPPPEILTNYLLSAHSLLIMCRYKHQADQGSEKRAVPPHTRNCN